MKFFNPLFFVAFLIGCSSGNDKSNESAQWYCIARGLASTL